jgi:RND family efflux transporter MFP subunit
LDQSRAALRSIEAGERPEEQRRREAALRAADAKLANARSEFERATRLLRVGAIARAAAEAAETTFRVAREEQQAAQQNLEMGTVGREEEIEARRAEVRGLEGRVVEAKLQLDDCTLRAPYDGVVAQRLVEERQNVRAMEPVVRFQDVEELDIVVDVPETVMVANIRTADIVQMVAEVSGAPGIQFPVTIREIAKEADPTTQTFRVRAAMEASKNVQILPGMTATVTVTFRRASILGNQLLVPVSAVMTPAGGGPVVWVVGPDQTVTPRPVKVGAVTGDRIEVVEGLQPGDRIVVAGVTQLREGQKVRDLGNALGGGSP